MEEAGRQVSIAVTALAGAMAQRLNLVVPPGVSLTATNDIIEVHSSQGGHESVVHVNGLGTNPPDRAHVLAAIHLVVDQVQDFIAIEQRVPWPGQTVSPPYA